METVGYITTVIVIIFVCCWTVLGLQSLFQKKSAPKLAGTVIPQTGEGLDINKRYDIAYTGGDFGSQFVERVQGVRIIGYIGKDSDEETGKMYLRSRWLVVEFLDGRRAYLMPHSIVSLQESANAG